MHLQSNPYLFKFFAEKGHLFTSQTWGKTYPLITPRLNMGKIWSMFFLSVLLVAALNWYAIEREPDVIEIGDVHEHVNEVVKIEGRIISWVEDPYGQGEQRLDIILEDDTGVMEIRWYKFGKLPTIGSTIQASGDVIEWNGRFWIQATGSGSIQWSEDDVAEPTDQSLTEISADPAIFDGKTVRIEGYLTKTILPDSTWSSIYIADHPNYANTKHQLKLYVSSATGTWIEAGSKITVVGEIHYDEREMRYVMYAQGPEILVDYTVLPIIVELEWDDISKWSYNDNKLVVIEGVPMVDDDGLWWLEGPTEGQIACIIPAEDDLDTFIQNANMSHKSTWSGRFVWSGLRHMWCIDDGGDEVTINPDDIQDLLGDIAARPVYYLENPEQMYTISAYMAYSLEPGSAEATGYIGDGPNYQSRNVLIKTEFQSARDAWLEAGQELVVNVSVGWSESDGKIVLTANYWDEAGPIPSPSSLSWNNGPLIWGYSANTMVTIDGILNSTTETSDTGIETTSWWLERPGTNEKLCINPADINVIVALHDSSEIWTGRLIEIEDRDSRSMQLCLSAGIVDDADEDGLSDSKEIALGTDINESDSDGDGHSDAEEYLAESDPLDENSVPE
jgi:hypothetical protein